MTTPLKSSRTPGKLATFGIPLAVVLNVAALVLPLPAPLLDFLLAFNIALAMVILLTAMLVREAVHFSVFPALLLVTTLVRLTLNVSSTRLVLTDGYAGKVIEAFGNFVVGGNLVVGLVIFLILVVIQFAVITSGAGRVAEVAARFTLDALPGKQMAIDADLNAGLINEEQARERREEIARDSDFFGAMDGASKFVKGDAMASVVIVLINLIGGFAIGVWQMGLSFGESMNKFALLSIGDGLVSQIPALFISVAAGIVITRVTTGHDGGLGRDLSEQLTRSSTALRIAAIATGVLGLLPGMPKLAFFSIAGILLYASFRVQKRQEADAAEAAAPMLEEPALAGDPDEPEVLIEQVRVDPLKLELAPDLLDLLEARSGGNLVERVRALRKRIASEMGLIVPPVRTSDVSSLPPSGYAIRVNGVVVASGEAPAGCALVLTDGVAGNVPGRVTTDPVFGLPAVWTAADLAEKYAMTGATVIDRASVIVTHLAEIVRSHAAELLSRQDVQTLLDAVRQVSPAVAAEIDGDRLSLAEVQRILGELLTEGVPITNLSRILEAVTAKARETRQLEPLVEAARVAIGPVICATAAQDGVLYAITFKPELEQAMLESVRQGESGSWIALDAVRMSALLEGLAAAVEQAERAGHRPVLVCAAQLRASVRRLVAAGRPDLRILSYPELSRAVTINPIGEVDLVQS